MTTDVVWQLHSLIDVVAASNFLSEFGRNYETSIRILANKKQSRKITVYTQSITIAGMAHKNGTLLT